MRWINHIFIGLLFAEISGSILFIIWFVLRKVFEKIGALDGIYYGIRVTCILFFAPMIFMCFNVRNYMRGYMLSYTGLISHALGRWVAIIMMVWFIGTVISFGFCIRSIGEYRRIERFRKCCSEEETYLFEQCKEMLGIKQEVVLYRYTMETIPFAIGLMKPAVYIPEVSLDQEELKMIFAHELTHIKYHDLWYRWITTIIRCAYWYNPLVYYLKSAHERWCEYHCDYMLCNTLVRPKPYFALLTNFVYEERIFELSVMFREQSSELRRRMEKMTCWKNKKVYMKYAVVVVVVCVCILNIGSVFAAEKVMEKVYNKEFEVEKMTPASESEDLGNTLTEYTMTGPFEGTVVEMTDDTMVLGTTKYIDWTMNANTTYLTSVFSASAGDYIAISVVFSPNDVTMRAGIVKPNGEKIYVSSTRGITHTFTADVSGSYQVFVTNPNSEKVLVDGSYSVY